MNIILLVVLLILIFGGLPAWGTHSYGYAPSGLLSFILVILLVLYLLGRI